MRMYSSKSTCVGVDAIKLVPFQSTPTHMWIEVDTHAFKQDLSMFSNTHPQSKSTGLYIQVLLVNHLALPGHHEQRNSMISGSQFAPNPKLQDYTSKYRMPSAVI